MARTNTAPKPVMMPVEPAEGPADFLSVAVPGGRGTIKMRPLDGGGYIMLRRGAEDWEMMQATLDAIIDYLPGEDPRRLKIEDLMSLGAAWLDAMTLSIVPPTKA